MKGISREVVPYAVDGLVGEIEQRAHVISEQANGVELFIDLDVIDPADAARTRRLLENALSALDRKAKPAVTGRFAGLFASVKGPAGFLYQAA